MALLTLSTESALTEAGIFVLTASVFHGLAVNFGFCACSLHVTYRHSRLTRLVQKFGCKQSHETDSYKPRNKQINKFYIRN